MKDLSKRNDTLKRKQKKVILLNNLEAQALDKYFKKYKIDNQSKFMRETIMRTILKKFSDDYPTLWDQPGVTVHARLSIRY
jgi:oligoribonuclease NrnB/cAMP/cGMP phosphodiesterase (DHH superfamily)